MRHENFGRGAPLVAVAGVVMALGLLPSGLFGEMPEAPPPQSSTMGEAIGRVSSPPESEVVEGPRDLVATHQIRVLGSVLRPTDTDATYSSSGSGGCVYATASPVTFFNTFLSLPDGATLTQARFYFNDTSGSDSFLLLSELDYDGDVVSEWRLDSWGDTGSRYDTYENINHVIDMANYSYVLRWRPVVTGSVMQACGVRLWFHVPDIFASGFENGDATLWSATGP